MVTLLTIDWLLVFHLNLRYLILWSSERLLKFLKFLYLISCLSYIFIVCLFALKPIDWDHISNIMFTGYFIWDVIYIIHFIGTYCYIFIKYKKHKQLVKHYKAQPNNRDHFRILIPTCMIVTHIIIICMPDFFHRYFSTWGRRFQQIKS